MPRLSPDLLRKVYSIEPHVARLLPVCRDIASARSELRWIREHAKKINSRSPFGDINRLVYEYASRRASGEPLQYVLGSEFFGDLEIKCRPGVLIPRQETAASVTRLVNLLSSNAQSLPSALRILDLCTGTACIPLLFHHEFYSRQSKMKLSPNVYLDIIGIDISSTAIELAQENKALQLASLNTESSGDTLRQDSLRAMAFLWADVLRRDDTVCGTDGPRGPLSILRALQKHDKNITAPSKDILISNPPYISRSDYYRTTSPSVRRFEPKLALVPPALGEDGTATYNGDLFYHHILQVARQLDSQILLLEVADLSQAQRVALLIAQQDQWDGIEIWRDDPRDGAKSAASELLLNDSTSAMTIRILGEGEARSVLAYRGRGRQWVQSPWR